MNKIITSYNINLLGRRVNNLPYKMGYKKYKEGFIKEISYGRFHLYNNGETFNIHFDVYLDEEKHHMVLPSKDTLQKEIKKIIGYLRQIPIRQVKIENKFKRYLCVKCKKTPMDNQGKCIYCKNPKLKLTI